MQERGVIDLIKECEKGNIDKRDISHAIGYGFTDDEVKEMTNMYNQSNKKVKEIIKYVLTDCNYHEVVADLVASEKKLQKNRDSR